MITDSHFSQAVLDVRPAVETSAAYLAGAAAKRQGLPQMPPAHIPGDVNEQLIYELEWSAGWLATDVVFEEAKKRIVQAVRLMSDAQLAKECKNMRRNWSVALRLGSAEAAWQHALAREERRREPHVVPPENVRLSFALA